MRWNRHLFLFLALASYAQAAPLKWEAKDGYRVAALDVPKTGRTGFTLLTPAQTGIHFTNQLTYARSQANQNLLDGSGLAAGDFDGRRTLRSVFLQPRRLQCALSQ